MSKKQDQPDTIEAQLADALPVEEPAAAAPEPQPKPAAAEVVEPASAAPATPEPAPTTAVVPLAQVPAVMGEGQDGNPVVLVDPSTLDEQQLAEVEERATNLDMLDTNEVMLFGSQPQQELSGFLDTLLADIPVEAGGIAGDLTVELSTGIEMTKVEDFQVQMTEGRPWYVKLPIIGKWWDASVVFFAKQGDFKQLLDKIVTKAKRRQDELMQNNIKLDTVYAQNEQTQEQMARWILAGEYAVQLAEAKLAELKQTAADSGLPADAAAVLDFVGQFTQFQVRVADMKTAYLRSMVSGPQIRTVQEAAKIEMANITRSILNDIPALKAAIVMVAANYKTLLAQAERGARRDAVRRLDKLTTETTGQAYLQAKRSQGEAEEDAIHIADMAKSLLGTLQEGARIEEENLEKRKRASNLLAQTKQDLVAGLAKIDEAQAALPEPTESAAEENA